MMQRLILKRFIPLALLLLGVCLPARADLIKQSAGYTRTILMTSASDHITGATGLTLTVVASKAGAAPATITPVVAEIGNGRYALALTATHTNTLGALDLTVTATGADPSDTHDQVLVDVPGGVVSGVTGPMTGTLTGNLIGSISGNVQGGVFGDLGGRVYGSVNSVTLPVTAGTVTDKTGYGLAPSQAFSNSTASTVTPMWYTAPANPATVSLSTGDETKLTFLDAAISSRMATFTYTAPPTDYQQRGVPVVLPGTAPTGYGGGSTGDTSGVTTLLTRIPGTVQPQTGDAYAAANGLTSGIPSALLLKPIKAGLTLGQLLVTLAATDTKAANITNTWNSTTHVLTTVYQFAGDSGPVLTTQATYPTTQATIPALVSVTATLGTVTQP